MGGLASPGAADGEVPQGWLAVLGLRGHRSHLCPVATGLLLLVCVSASLLLGTAVTVS